MPTFPFLEAVNSVFGELLAQIESAGCLCPFGFASRDFGVCVHLFISRGDFGEHPSKLCNGEAGELLEVTRFMPQLL